MGRAIWLCAAVGAFVLATGAAGSAVAAPPERHACTDGRAPAGARAPNETEAPLVASALSAARSSVPVSVVDRLPGFCVTREAVFVGAMELDTGSGPASALAVGRVAYALGIWAAGRSATPQDAELHAARAAGCTLARLNIRGDDLTTQLLELRDFTGPHADARAWTLALQEGHASCAL